MSFPKNLINNLTPQEINFMAENEYITILPRYSMKKVELITTKLPSLRAMRREQIPLWVALILKSQDKCNIIPPEWLSVKYLKEKYEEEIKYSNAFAELPWNWFELSKVLLEKASDDLPDPSHHLRSLLQDLREIRLIKSRKGLNELNESHIQLDGLSLLEINEMRPFVLLVMDKLKKLNDCISKHDEMDMDANGDDGMDEADYDNNDDAF